MPQGIGCLETKPVPGSSCAILIDANVLQDAVFEKPAIKTNTFRLGKPWGEVTCDVAVTVPSHDHLEEGWLQYEIEDRLPQLAEQVRSGRFEACISAELDFELAESHLGALVTSEQSFFHGINLRKVRAARVKEFETLRSEV